MSASSASTAPHAGPRATSDGRTGVEWRRAEFILLGLAVVSLVSLLIRVNTVWAGLPAHPLFIHASVVLIPLAILGALAVSARPAWFERYGVLLSLCAIAGMASIFLSENAGSALQSDLHLQASSVVNQHADAAGTLAVLFAVFTAVTIGAFASHRIAAGRPTGLTLADAPLAHPVLRPALRVLYVLLALVCAYQVYRVGDLGAKAVWASQLHHGAGH